MNSSSKGACAGFVILIVSAVLVPVVTVVVMLYFKLKKRSGKNSKNGASEVNADESFDEAQDENGPAVSDKNNIVRDVDADAEAEGMYKVANTEKDQA